MLASCSNEDMPGGEPLPDDQYPLQLTASVGSPQSRAAGKDSWTLGDQISVNLNGNTGLYTLNADGTIKNADRPVFWQNTAEARVCAWYPAGYPDPDKPVDISNQSNGFAAFDYLYASTTGSYTAPVSLVFEHCMAKVKCVLVKGDGVTDADLASAKVSIAGYTKVVFACIAGNCVGSEEGWITSTSDHEALLPPHDMGGKEFIKVEINGTSFIYSAPDDNTTANLSAGKVHTYTITVKANGIEVTAATGGSWADSGSENVRITITYDGTETEAKTGDYYYSDGSWSDGGLRKLYADGTMEWAVTTPQPVSGKTCIGIVFYTGQHETDQSNYASTGIGQEKCHGYAVALTDATSGYCMWGVYGTELECYPTDGGGNKLNNSRNPDIDWSGYAWTQKIITAAGGKGNLNASDEAGYPATWYAVVSYETDCNAPTNSSGWFLPSIGQMWNIYHNRSSLFNGKAVVKSLKSDWYWSSSELYNYPASIALYVSVNDGGVGSGNKRGRYSYVRPVLAF